MIDKDKFYQASTDKKYDYIPDGVIHGGDPAIEDVLVREIRRAVNSKYERIVIELEDNAEESNSAIEPPDMPSKEGSLQKKKGRPPYFHVAVNSAEKKLVFTLWGRPKFGFISQKVVSAFKDTPHIQNIELYPRLENDSWTFVVSLKAPRSVEVIELPQEFSQPARIVVDLKTPSVASSPRKQKSR